MKLNTRLSVMWSVLALLIAIPIAVGAQCHPVWKCEVIKIEYRQPSTPQPPPCYSCGFSLDPNLWRERITQPEELGIRFGGKSLEPGSVLDLQLAGPAVQTLEIKQRVTSRTQVVPLTKETKNAIQKYIGEGNRLVVTVETKAAKSRVQFQLVSIKQGPAATSH